MALSGLVLGGGLALDLLVGEPPRRLHPVAWFGQVVGRVDGEWRRPRQVGVVAALVLPILAALAVAGVVFAAGQMDTRVGAVAGALALFVTTSLRRLLERVREVTALSEEDVDAARERLRALAGRDAAALSPGELRSAAVESLAENLADGLVAPLAGYTVLAAATTAAGGSPLLAVSLGCGGAAWVKAVNTLDSMLGYRSKPVGWGPARLDDAAMWVPARVTAGLLALVSRAPLSLVRARRWNGDVPSPNSGWPMGTLAAILDVRLTKPGAYTLNGDAQLPDAAAAGVAVRKVALSGLVAYALAGVLTWT
ncbi:MULTISPECIES: adenosylcobinamide-phosphate synthase CbiB [Salinibaculum]|uniref:adenosylcobinamide-phosphate synthase CbiB n=1 Tax=Salinibaculum TaxID=2732368 RepID=UPI0030D07410